jgi:hypothetical protein
LKIKQKSLVGKKVQSTKQESGSKEHRSSKEPGSKKHCSSNKKNRNKNPKDPISMVGRLHCIVNSQHLEQGGVVVPANVNPGTPTFVCLADALARENCMLDHTARLAQWRADCNVKEACNRLLISRFESVYLQELAHPITKFKGVSIRTMISFLNRKYPAKTEDVASLETELPEPWDANNHIGNLFQSIKEGCETLLRMNAILQIQTLTEHLSTMYIQCHSR